MTKKIRDASNIIEFCVSKLRRFFLWFWRRAQLINCIIYKWKSQQILCSAQFISVCRLYIADDKYDPASHSICKNFKPRVELGLRWTILKAKSNECYFAHKNQVKPEQNTMNFTCIYAGKNYTR